MLIYNVTINVEESIEKEWLKWMKEVHIPEVLATKKFTKALMSKVLIEEEMGGVTYSVQYTAPDRAHLQSYYKEDQERLQAAGSMFAGRTVAFRTELEMVSEH